MGSFISCPSAASKFSTSGSSVWDAGSATSRSTQDCFLSIASKGRVPNAAAWDFDPDLIFADPRQPLRDALAGISPGSSLNGSEVQRAMRRVLEQLENDHD